MNKIKNLLKSNPHLWRNLLKIYLIPRTVRCTLEYLTLDRIYFEGKETKEKYLIFQPGGRSGLMTYLLGTLGWLEYAQRYGYHLVVDMRNQQNMYSMADGDNAWEYYYKQPLTEGRVDIDAIKAQYSYAICPDLLRQNAVFGYTYRWGPKFAQPIIRFPKVMDFKEAPDWQQKFIDLYRDHIRLSDDSARYLAAEQKALFMDKGKILGVLVRGTDYAQSRPYMHPVQPTAAEVLEKAKEIFTAGQYDFLYLATDESSAQQLFESAFPGKVIVNAREYYDRNDFSSQWLADVHSSRENDSYLRGMEYLSSMNLLAHCDGLVGGICGGTQAVLIMNGNRYKDLYLFDLGYYNDWQ